MRTDAKYMLLPMALFDDPRYVRLRDELGMAGIGLMLEAYCLIKQGRGLCKLDSVVALKSHRMTERTILHVLQDFDLFYVSPARMVSLKGGFKNMSQAISVSRQMLLDFE